MVSCNLFALLLSASTVQGLRLADVNDKDLVKAAFPLKTLNLWAATTDFEIMGAAQAEPKAESPHGCLKAPACLEPNQTCITVANQVRKQRPECKQLKEFCKKSVYKLPSTHLKITLPIMTTHELRRLYTNHYSGQMPIHSPHHWRPTQQARMILDARSNTGMEGSGLTVVEMGCASGMVLYNLKKLAANGGKLACFEADPHYHRELNRTFKNAALKTPGLTTKLFPQLFAAGVLNRSSVDIFTSSQTLEHFADPCPWLAEIYDVLKPGGLVFTEVPEQDGDPARGLTRGQFHLLYFKEQTFNAMMSNAGFKRVQSVTAKTDAGPAVRAVYQKPL